MPAIRDWTLNSNTVASNTLTGFIPNYSQNDLLLAVLSNVPVATSTTLAGSVTTFTLTFNGGFSTANNVNITYGSGGAIGTNTMVLSTATGVIPGQVISGTGLPADTIVIGFSGLTVTLSNNFTVQAAGFYTVFPVSVGSTLIGGGLTNGTKIMSQQTATVPNVPSNTYASGGAIGASTVTFAAIFAGQNGALITGTGLPVGTYITAGAGTTTVTLSNTFTVQAAGTYSTSNYSQATYASGGASGANTFVVNTIGRISVGDFVSGTGIVSGTRITAISGTTVTLSANLNLQAAGTYNFYHAGGYGTYLTNVSNTSTVTATSVYPAQVFSGNGWTTLFTNTTATACQAVLYKIATASESDTTFTYLSNTTGMAHVISVQDVNTTTPFNGTGGTGTGYNTFQNSSVRSTMPQITTTVANSLILYLQETANNTIPTILEGPVIYEDGADGAGNSQAFSWGFAPSIGATSNAVYYERLSSATLGLLTTIGISPPATGATIIPAYCTSDNSVYVDPISGTTAYNGNTAFAATATTSFGTTLNGATLANGTVAAATDVGINSYHSLGQITGTATAGTWYGGALAPATGNRPTVAGKNVLVHVKPATPKVLQNTDGIGHAVVKGVAFGMASTNATNYKVWHVHGQGTAWNSAQHVPVVINTNNTSGLIQNTGTIGSDPIVSFGMMISGEVVAPIWQFGSLWVLDTTTVCGGNAVYPVDTKGLVKSASTGKERLSVLQQGIAQALILQPIQFGNGGTNPIYLNLDSSAIEVPTQYNIGKKQVFYCSADNVAGISYYAGPSDTIIHSNATIISQNKFFWGFNAATSASATYNFNSTIINGAGTITLQEVVPLSQLTFISCDQITIPDYFSVGAPLTSCVFNKTTATSTQGAVVISAATQAELQAKLDRLVSCQFTGNTTSGGALRIQYTGTAAAITLTTSTLTFSGNTADIYFDAPAGSSLLFKNYNTANAVTAMTTNSNAVVIQNVTTFGKLSFGTLLQQDGANAVYRLFYKQINVFGSSRAYGYKDAVLVQALNTDLSGDGSYEVKGDLTGGPASVTFDYDYTGNTQAAWAANTTYNINDEYRYGSGWYRVTVAYTSGATRTNILDGTNSVSILGPSVQLVTIGTNYSQYFTVGATLLSAQTTVIASTNTPEANYSGS